LVPHQTPARVRELVEAHLKTQGYFIVDHEPTPAERLAHARVAKLTWEAGYAATRISLDAPLSRALTHAVEDALEGPVVQLPILGGSVPLDVITSTLHAPVIVFPIVNHDNNQHASNENLRLQNLFDGIVVYAGAIARMGQYWQ
jgi:acetylornithine deacetylase/succinyl-diaminopimelate desuccinylase-like protein